jgi:hypothetical protein
MDTEGEPLPADVASFFARGAIDAEKMASFVPRLERENIQIAWVDVGDQHAGSIRLLKHALRK